ncbi:MAG: prephenate dehydrogenase/arogenate dehydrogenase family protein [Lawsonibacter sp.]|nr:prephenate dehydrogenase/arogenate dehydrogenase family protein [Lawsonibacter sp.]
MKKTIAVIGLGLIGGSMAMALKGFEDYELLGADVSQPTLRYALEHGIIDRASDEPAAAAAQADLVLLCMHPQGIVSFLTQHRDCFRPGAMVTDVCGIKGAVVRAVKGMFKDALLDYFDRYLKVHSRVKPHAGQVGDGAVPPLSSPAFCDPFGINTINSLQEFRICIHKRMKQW